MRRNLRLWWLALGISLLLHGALFSRAWWTLPRLNEPIEMRPFEARLVSPPPSLVRPAPPPPVRPAPPPAPPPATPPPPVAAAVKVIPPAAIPPSALPLPAIAPPAEPAVATPPTESADFVEALPPPAALVPQAVQPVEPVAPLNALPPRIDLRFKVRYGLAAGEQTMVWVNESGKRYTVISVAEATGLAGMFYRGKFVQTSRGRITPLGLEPEEFWDQRGRKRSSAQFNATQGQLTLSPDKGTPRHFAFQPGVQDVLSLFFQMALTAPPAAGTVTYSVFNGKKLRDYTFRVEGEATLDTAVGSLRTLHLAREADSDGRFEVWLAIDRHYLPVRVVRSDDENNEVELTILSIE